MPNVKYVKKFVQVILLNQDLNDLQKAQQTFELKNRIMNSYFNQYNSCVSTENNMKYNEKKFIRHLRRNILLIKVFDNFTLVRFCVVHAIFVSHQ